MLDLFSDPGFIAAVGTVGGGIAFKAAEVRLSKPKRKPIDWHWVREQEMEVWGEYFSELKCGPGCNKCKPKKPIPPKGPGGVSRRASSTTPNRPVCAVCAKSTVAVQDNMCQQCMTQHFEKTRNTQIRRPAEVPRHANHSVHYNAKMLRHEVIWTWRDNGRDCAYRQPVALESFNITNADLGDYNTVTNGMRSAPNKCRDEGASEFEASPDLSTAKFKPIKDSSEASNVIPLITGGANIGCHTINMSERARNKSWLPD